MRKLFAKLTSGLAVVLATAALAPAPLVLAQGPGVQVSGSIFGFYDTAFEGKGAWVGFALIAFGDDQPVIARFADRNTSIGVKPNGSICGTETISLLFLDGSGTLDILGTFVLVPQSTPNLFTLSETGTFSNGTGKYSGVTGHVTVHGPFMFPKTTPGSPPWISEIHGVIVGLQ